MGHIYGRHPSLNNVLLIQDFSSKLSFVPAFLHRSHFPLSAFDSILYQLTATTHSIDMAEVDPLITYGYKPTHVAPAVFAALVGVSFAIHVYQIL